jgi:hypothetical protein
MAVPPARRSRRETSRASPRTGRTVLERVDPEHPDIVAPVHGPLALFALGELVKDPMRREDIVEAKQTSRGSDTWRSSTATGTLTFKPFPAIADEQYRLYHQVQS